MPDRVSRLYFGLDRVDGVLDSVERHDHPVDAAVDRSQPVLVRLERAVHVLLAAATRFGLRDPLLGDLVREANGLLGDCLALWHTTHTWSICRLARIAAEAFAVALPEQTTARA